MDIHGQGHRSQVHDQTVDRFWRQGPRLEASITARSRGCTSRARTVSRVKGCDLADTVWWGSWARGGGLSRRWINHERLGAESRRPAAVLAIYTTLKAFDDVRSDYDRSLARHRGARRKCETILSRLSATYARPLLLSASVFQISLRRRCWSSPPVFYRSC